MARHSTLDTSPADPDTKHYTIHYTILYYSRLYYTCPVSPSQSSACQTGTGDSLVEGARGCCIWDWLEIYLTSDPWTYQEKIPDDFRATVSAVWLG